jgi:2'-5' RNA ligase
MTGCKCAESGINSFALISYLPEPLAGFLDSLRRELVHHCIAKTHVTLLPPRPLAVDAPDAWQSLQGRLEQFPPFELELDRIEVFAVTNVIYLSIRGGYLQLEKMHAQLNTGHLRFVEPFQYHPHVTLAQDLALEQVHAAAELASRWWADFKYPKKFIVDELMFVQNTSMNRWADLAGYALSKDLAAAGNPLQP